MNHSYQPFQPILTKAGLHRFELFFDHVPACKNLSGIVHSYLQISTAKATPYPVIPDGTQAIFIAPHGSLIGGAQSQACDIQINQPGDYFGIRFYPGALRHFFDLNVAEITDQYADSHYFPCQEFAHLHDDIYTQANFKQRTQICD